MATRLGDASIRILLEPQAAQEELRKLDEKIVEVDKLRQDEIRKVTGDIETSKRAIEEEKRKGDGLLATLKGAYREAVQISTKVVPAVTGFQRGVSGEGPTGIQKTIQDLAGKVLDLEAWIRKWGSTVSDVSEYETALFKLGGKFPHGRGELQLGEAFARINEAEIRFQRAMEVAETERIFRNFGKSLSASFQR